MKRIRMIGWSVAFLLCATMLSCSGVPSGHEVSRIDSLNHIAYVWRYCNLDSSCQAAHQAYQSARRYSQGRAEASNNLGFCAFMRMDFAEAERRHREVYRLTKHEVELLIADVGLMKIYQRTAQNKEFYDYRNSALRRLRRIGEDANLFTGPHERMRLNYARSEFHIVSAVYYYYLQQRPEAMLSIEQAAVGNTLEADTNQLLYYHYIKGSAALCEGDTPDERRLKEFDELFYTWRMATPDSHVYFEGNALQGLAALMITPESYEFFEKHRPYVVNQFGVAADTLLPKRLAEMALEKFRRYDDPYQIVGGYVSIGKYLNMHGRYQEALDTLNVALSRVEGQQPAVPEWELRIREQLSVSYAGLGMKPESDFNRNVYLDILDDSRQDKELESRYQALEEEAHQLNLLLSFVGTGFVFVLVVFVFFHRCAKKRNRRHLNRLAQVLEVSRRITGAIPADAADEEEINAAIQSVVGEHPNPSMMRLIRPYVRWALDNGMVSLSLGDERKRLEKQRYIHEQHIAENKRQNIVKKACLSIVSGIHPYIDRIINETDKLTEKGFINNPEIKAEKFQYIDELVSVINEYNHILADWIKMKQGSLSLNIETFELKELFDLLRKGNRTFELKRQTLEVLPTEACVRADKALTMFMLNTLSDNARKYTPRGGWVKVSAVQADEYVEISVEDSGRGLSEEDVARITSEKVYDSQTIGMNDAPDEEELRRSKGGGFGLMNCKGIIEKYRKTNELFRVCLFGVESRLGEGSRFYFRLPVGVRRVLSLWLLALGLGIESSAQGFSSDAASDSLSLEARLAYEELLDDASDYANSAYYSNVDGNYEQTVLYVDSAMMCLNEHYRRYAAEPQRYMTLTGEGRPAELLWWDEYFNSDFHVILDIRNEAAVAFLALRNWSAYTYNNNAYTTLYKLLGEDQSLEAYCQRLQRSTTNKLVGIVIGVLLFIALLLGYYFLYLRKRLMQRWNLEQVLEINERLFAVSENAVPDEEGFRQIPVQIIHTVFDAVNELLSIERLGIAGGKDLSSQLEKYFFPTGEEYETGGELIQTLIRRCFDEQVYLSENNMQVVPLMVDAAEERRCIGVLYLERKEGTVRESDRLYLELIAGYVAIVLFNDMMKLSDKYRDVEDAQDETRRASWEESQLHVQNLVLDNCLSTIKHETVYYPNKIKQLITRLRAGGLAAEEEREQVRSISELITYYKGIFTLLHTCAARQLEEVTFRRTTIPVASLMEAAEKYFRRANKGGRIPLAFRTEGVEASVIGDIHQLRFLLESLIDEALAASENILFPDGKHSSPPDETSLSESPSLLLSAREEGGFIRFTFTDPRRTKTRDELNRLFYPDVAHTEYLVCKQIIREHDEYSARRGCRINAEACAEGGFSVYFTVPKRMD